ncbi:MAG: CHAT domain-containing protein [Betaproteobacteria bacterium]|nr:CHAT domain-containing protein [Betaproteobacteria bacterium]
MVAEAFGGNLFRALEAAGQLGAGDPAWALVGLAPMVRIHAEMGNLPASRAALQRAEAAYAHLQTLPSWGFTGTNWKAMMGLGRGALEQAQGHLAEAEKVWRQRVADSGAAARAMANLRQYSKLPPPPEMMLQLWADAELQLSKNLALQGRSGEAEGHARSALLKVLQGFGRYSTQSAQAITDLGSAVFEAGRFKDAEALARAAIASYEQGGAAPESWYFALARGLLGSALAAQGRWAEADAVYEARDRGLAADAQQYQSGDVSGRDVNWGYAMLRNGKAQAGLDLLERVYRRRLRLGLPDEEYFTAQARGFYALGLSATGRKDAALKEFRGALPVLLDDARRGGGEQGGAVGRQLRLVWILEGYMQLLVELEATAEGRAALAAANIEVAAETFRVADIARGGAVQRALAESAARATPDDPALAALARREQDAEQRFGALSDLLNRMLALPPERQVPAVVAELRAGIETLRGERAALKRELAQRYPSYAELIAPHPPGIAAVQAALRAGEALLAVYVGAERSYAWAVPKQGAPAFAPVALGEAELARTVAGLRRALDVGEAELARFPRFDLEASHALYAKLLAPVEAGWRNANNLLVVPHKALAQLPFAVLATAPAKLAAATPLFAEYRTAPWLIRKTAITQLPSVATLLTLRRMPAGSAARKAFVGFGDPLFSKAMAAGGDAGAARDAGASGAGGTRGLRLRSLAISSILARQADPAVAGIHALPAVAVANSAGLAQLSRLPDTAEEIRSIARVLGADQADVLLGAAASGAMPNPASSTRGASSCSPRTAWCPANSTA